MKAPDDAAHQQLCWLVYSFVEDSATAAETLRRAFKEGQRNFSMGVINLEPSFQVFEGWDQRIAVPETFGTDHQGLEQHDKAQQAPSGGMVFTGSSSIARSSSLAQDMKPLPVIN